MPFSLVSETREKRRCQIVCPRKKLDYLILLLSSSIFDFIDKYKSVEEQIPENVNSKPELKLTKTTGIYSGFTDICELCKLKENSKQRHILNI